MATTRCAFPTPEMVYVKVINFNNYNLANIYILGRNRNNVVYKFKHDNF